MCRSLHWPLSCSSVQCLGLFLALFVNDFFITPKEDNQAAFEANANGSVTAGEITLTRPKSFNQFECKLKRTGHIVT